MLKNNVRDCPKFGYQLRFPVNIGGVVMVCCPSCGNRFHSDFKLGKVMMHKVLNKSKNKDLSKNRGSGSGLRAIV